MSYWESQLNGKCQIVLAAIILGGVVGFVDFAAFASEPSGKGRVIEFGWDTPTISWLCDNVAITECTTAFHGIILDLARREDQGGLSWLAWGNTTIAGELEQRAEEDIALLNDADFTRLRENSFFRLNSSGWLVPPDWFDGDFSTVVSNIAFMADAVNQTGLEGIAFDPEDYFSNCWYYPDRKYHATKTFEEYQVQVRQRGWEIASAIKSACPGRDFTLLFLFANSLPYISTQWWGHPLREDSYGLLPAFVDGLLDEAGEQIRIIDGIESAYPNKTLAEFQGSISNYEGGATLSADPSRYLSCVGIGFGTWMDYRSNELGWYTNPNDFNLNHFTPETFNQAMDISTDLAELSWVYTQIPDWYLGTVPEAYFNALSDVTGLPPADLWARLLRAKDPLPADGAWNVHPDVVLGWEAGIKAASHDVYFGTDTEAVGDANTSETLGVYVGRQDTCEYAPAISLVLGQTYCWRIDEVNDVNIWQGRAWSFTVDDGKAGNPNPTNGAEDVEPNVVLGWSPGENVASHDVYFGTDFDSIEDANTSSEEYKGRQDLDANSYDPCGVLELGATYYWRIDEVSGANVYKGEVWSFKVANYIILDDMESYNNTSEMFGAWKGWPYPDWDNGASANLEETIVHGGVKAMKFLYSNLWPYSTVTHIYSEGQDWAGLGVEVLALWFRGESGNDSNDQPYVMLKDGSGGSATVPYNGDADDVMKEQWQLWKIELQNFSDGGVDLTDVEEVTIGSTGISSGYLYFDDIGLYVRTCVPEAGPVADLTGDCFVNFKDLAILGNQWLQSPGVPSADIAPETPDSFVDWLDLAVLTDSWLDSALWPGL